MRKIRTLILLILLCGFPTLALSGDVKVEGYQKQVNKIDLFYKVLNKKSPKISDFNQLFGRGNEAELELILRQDFPSINLEEWDLNKKAVEHVNGVMARPSIHASRFLSCLRMKEPAVFKPKTKYHIQTPPEVTNNFRRFTVSIDNDHEDKIIFEFSQDEVNIEAIYLPDGKPVYTLINGCGK